jgi:transposase
VNQIRSLNGSIKQLDKKLVEAGSQLDGYKNLVSIKGIGDRSAAILLSTIGNVHDFSDESKLFSYFGIVPRVSNSNETERSGKITKRGTKLGRTTLVQCTLIAIRYSDYLRKFYDRIKTKKGSGKAIIATAKKLLSIIYRTLKNNWVFEDFGNFVLAK